METQFIVTDLAVLGKQLGAQPANVELKLMRGDGGASYDEARRRLERAALVLTAAECGVRMFPGGVYLGSDFGETTVLGQFGRWIRRHLEVAACTDYERSRTMGALHVGADRRRMQKGALCWPTARPASSASRHRPIRPAPATDQRRGGGAMGGIGEVFRRTVVGDKPASRRTSASSPGCEDVDAIDLAYQPAAYWILDLGNLGQAALWTIGLLPYADPAVVPLFLQEADNPELGNLAIQV